MQVSPVQVYQEVLAQGGDQTQAQVAAALVSGIESNGDPTELSGGRGPAAGLFQYEPGTWIGQGGGKYAPVAQDASWQDQVAVFVNGTKGDNFGAWGPDLAANGGDPNSASNPNYGRTGGPEAGSKVGNIIAANSASWGAAAPVDLSGGGTGGGGGAAASATSTATPTRTATVNGVAETGTDAQINALETTQQLLDSYGLGSLTNWAWGEITSGADPTLVSLDLQNTPEFQARFPGIVEQKAYNTAHPDSPVPVISVADYLSYETTANQYASAMGLPPGLLNKDGIGKLIGGNVSLNELNARMNDAMTLATNSTPEQRTMFNQYFGVEDQYVSADNPFGTGANAYNAHGPLTTGQIAALALDPNASEPLIKQQILAAQVGGAGASAGIGGISADEAVKIAQNNPGLSQAGITSAVGQASVYDPFLHSRPGMGGEAKQGTLSADQLIGTQLDPNAANQRQLQTAQEVGKAPFSGGGGPTSNQTGVVGAGSASPTSASK